MNVEKFCTAFNIKIDSNNNLKDRTVWKSCCNKNRRKNNKNALIQIEIITSNHKPKIENVNSNKNVNSSSVSTYEDHTYVVIGPRNFGKVYYMLKILEKTGNKRPIHIITRSPNQNLNYKTSTKIKPIDKYKGSVVIFDDMLGARNSSQIDNFYRRGRHENLEVYYISQSYFRLPRQNIRINCDRLILFNQTLRDVQSLYYDIGAYEMFYSEFKEMCRRA